MFLLLLMHIFTSFPSRASAHSRVFAVNVARLSIQCVIGIHLSCVSRGWLLFRLVYACFRNRLLGFAAAVSFAVFPLWISFRSIANKIINNCVKIMTLGFVPQRMCWLRAAVRHRCTTFGRFYDSGCHCGNQHKRLVWKCVFDVTSDRYLNKSWRIR